VRIIALSTLKRFLDARSEYADACGPVMAGFREVKSADWANPAASNEI